LSKSECLELAAQLDSTLEAERSSIRAQESAVIPLPFSLHLQDWFENDHATARLALLHSQVIVPIVGIEQWVWQGWQKRVERAGLQALHDWTKRHASLIRSGAVLPFSHEVYLTHAVNQLCWRATLKLDVSDLAHRVTDFAPVVPIKSKDESVDIIHAVTHSLLEQLFCVRKISTTPVFTDRLSYNLWDALSPRMMIPATNQPCEISRTLVELRLPDLTNISSEDIARLRADSEVFALWRARLWTVLRNARKRVEEGRAIDLAFQEESWPLKDAVEAIRKEMKSGSVFHQLKATGTTVLVGGAAVAATHYVLEYLGIPTTTMKDLVRLGPAAAASLLWWLFFNNNKQNDKETIVKVYSAIL
jgi:hypothetical protein